MILRRPYAILIKYFKPIHIVMFVLFSYLVFAIRKIYMFFVEYIKAGSFTYFENISRAYVPGILFIIVIILLAFSIGIFLLMHKKEKPVLFYRIMIGYCVFLIGYFIYCLAFFKSLESITYEPLRIVVNRDVSLFTYLANFVFVVMAFIRGFGFDIKKFSFEKDKKELNLEESDSEEYELNVSIEKDDIKSFINKNKRELSYYVRENKLILSIFGLIILVVAILYIYFNFFVINKIYKEGENINGNKIVYRVNSSTITNTDKYGHEISSQHDYLIINMNILNSAGTGYLDNQALRVDVDGEYFYPSTNVCDLFSDLGNCYKNQELKMNTDNNFIIIYKINKEYKNMYLEILKSNQNGYQYGKVKLSYKQFEVHDAYYNVNDEILISDKTYKLTNYSLADRTTYQYEECTSGKCSTYTKIVSPKVGEIVLALEFDNLDGLSDDFLNSAIGLKYYDIVYTGKDIKLISKYKNKLYYSVPNFLKGSDNFYLTITMRSSRYGILLGGK